MKISKIIPLITMTTVITSCGSMQYTQTGKTFSSRSVNCDFRIFTTTPQEKYEEVGVIDFEPGFDGAGVPRDIASLKEKVGPEVCKQGGNGVIGLANGYGMYMKATVIKLEK